MEENKFMREIEKDRRSEKKSCHDKVLEQRKEEMSYTEEQLKIPVSHIGKNLSSINYNVLSKDVSEKFDNPGMMNVTSDIMRGVYYHIDRFT